MVPPLGQASLGMRGAGSTSGLCAALGLGEVSIEAISSFEGGAAMAPPEAAVSAEIWRFSRILARSRSISAADW